MIYSGLDWSEDVGGPLGYIAMVHVDACDMAKMEGELAAARRRLGRDEDYVFKHVDAKPIVHHHFYRAISNVPSLRAHVYRYNRSTWVLQHTRPVLGDPCICDSIINLTLLCPRHLVDGQTLFIDYPRKEIKIVDAFRTALRKSMKKAKGPTFRSIKPRPDDRLEGGIVQVADMNAGEVRENAGVSGDYLLPLGARIQLVP